MIRDGRGKEKRSGGVRERWHEGQRSDGGGPRDSGEEGQGKVEVVGGGETKEVVGKRDRKSGRQRERKKMRV